jgi:membrane-associated phospholipid phosphatase
VLTAFGGEVFFLILLPLVYWCLDRRTGARLTLLFLTSTYVNAAAKGLFALPRPTQYAPDRLRELFPGGIVEASEAHDAPGYGLPSGHTQGTFVAWGYLASQADRVSAKASRVLVLVIAALLIVLVPLSRVYLAVHFPHDVVAGYLLGGMILMLFLWMAQPAEAAVGARSTVVQLCLALGIPIALVLITPGETTVTSGATLAGMGVGFVLERRWVRFRANGAPWRRGLRFGVGMIVMLGLYLGLSAAFAGLTPALLFRFVRYGLMGVWGALGAPWTFVQLRLAHRDQPNRAITGQPGCATGLST